MSDNTAVAIREEITEAKVMEYLNSAGITNNLLPNEKKMFFNIAREFGLNPFKREIHITAYGEGDYRKCSIITGYEVYIKRAERTGKLDGWKVWTEGDGKSLKAVVEIYRKDQKYPFVHEAYYIECCQYNKNGLPNAIWAKQPRFMTKKVAIGQAFRLCFPDDLGGMPYEETEIPQEEPRNVT
jgi:phage recombination protein Bet